ncbi:MAG TPA: hypothetical protein VF069_19295 [Streptosporangiaceae bacterium]
MSVRDDRSSRSAGGGAEPAAPRARSRAHPGLVAVCVVLPGVEAVVLLTLGLRGSVPLAPAVTATAPYGVFHDLRFLLVYHSSWWSAVAGTLGLLAWRTTVEVVLDRLAWPRDLPPPRLRDMLGKGAGFVAFATLVLTPPTALLCGMALAPVSYLFFGAIPVVVAFAALTPHGGLTTWWSRPPPARTVVWSLLAFGMLTAGGMVLAAAPAWATPLLAAGCGAGNAWARLGVVTAVANHRLRRALPLVPISMVVLIALAIAGTTGAVRLLNAERHTRQQARLPAGAGPHPVLLVSGYGTRWSGRPPAPLAPGLPVTRFSYAGEARDGRPLPFPTGATDQPLDGVVRLLARQVEVLHRRTGRPVAIVSESEGALAAQVYLATHPGAPVDRLMLLSPLTSPGRAYFPPAGIDGWGVATGTALAGISAAVGRTTPLHVPADNAFVRSIADHAPALRALSRCPPPGVATAALVPLADAVATPYATRTTIPVGVVAGLHGELVDDGDTARTVAVFVATGRLPAGAARSQMARIVRAATAAWQVPPLKPSLVPRWHAEEVSGCTSVTATLGAWISRPGPG